MNYFYIFQDCLIRTRYLRVCFSPKKCDYKKYVLLYFRIASKSIVHMPLHYFLLKFIVYHIL